MSAADAEKQAIEIVALAESQAVTDAIDLERQALENVQNILGKSGNADFLFTFLWLRLVQNKVTLGIKTNFIMDNPLFHW